MTWKGNSEAFGKTILEPTNKITMNLRFPGQYYDQETELHYNYFRDYDPSLGRYNESDPIGLDGGINPYGYVGANPFMYYDPYGLWSFSDAYFGTVNKILPDVVTDFLTNDTVVNSAAGLGDGIILVMTYGAVDTNKLRQDFDIGNVDTCAEEYVIGKVTGAATAFSVAYYSRYTNWEMVFSKNFRVAPWGHRSNNGYANFPHYHRRGPQITRTTKSGNTITETAPGQGMGNHRPWQGGF